MVCAALLASLPAQALYKVVSPDGRVTYTDTPPAASAGTRVIQLGSHANVIADTAVECDVLSLDDLDALTGAHPTSRSVCSKTSAAASAGN